MFMSKLKLVSRIGRRVTEQLKRFTKVNKSFVILTGLLTTQFSTYTLIGILANDLKIQSKLHNEIDEKLAGRLPTINDRKQLHYMEAVRSIFLILLVLY